MSAAELAHACGGGTGPKEQGHKQPPAWLVLEAGWAGGVSGVWGASGARRWWSGKRSSVPLKGAVQSSGQEACLFAGLPPPLPLLLLLSLALRAPAAPRPHSPANCCATLRAASVPGSACPAHTASPAEHLSAAQGKNCPPGQDPGRSRGSLPLWEPCVVVSCSLWKGARRGPAEELAPGSCRAGDCPGRGLL